MAPLLTYLRQTALSKRATDARWKLYFFEGRNTGIAARSEEEARGKKKRGGEALVNVRNPSEAELRLMEGGHWVLTRSDGLPPGKSAVEGRGVGPPPKVKQASLVSRLRAARNATHTHPTPGQASAGNYRLGRLNFHGLSIALENPKGTERRGYDSNGNITWKRVMVADYGFFVGSMAADGDAVDCFLGDDLDSEFVAVVDQIKTDGSFDESKIVLGVKTQAQAEKLYLAHYPRGWKLGPVSTTTVQQLKTWLKEGDTKSPFKGQMVKVADWQNTCPGCGAEGTYGGDREKPSKELCYKCDEAVTLKCEHGINVPFNTCDQGCKEPIKKSAAAQPEQDTALRKDWILGGAAASAAGGKLQFDLAAQRAKARDWEASMHWQSRGLEDSKLRALDTDQLLTRAQDLTDDYIRGGQRTAQSKILGVTAGQVPKLQVWRDYLQRALADRSPDGLAGATRDLDGRLNHYSMFSDRALAPEAIRGHMVEKAINSLDSGVLEKLDPSVRQILTHGDAHMKDRLAAIGKIPGADVGGITKLLTTALRGTGDAAHGPARFGEMVRLAGQRGQALNTGQIYRLASGGAMRGLHGAGSVATLLGGGMLAATGFSALKDRLHKSAAAAFDRTADNMSEGQRTSLAAILAGASPMSAVSGFHELRRKDLNRIGVTYGEQNYQHAEIGGGHKEPAVSLAEILEDENHRRGSKYEIARYARNRDGMLGRVEGLRSVEERLAGVKDTSRINTFERALRGDHGVNVMVNTGFGDYVPKASHMDLRFSAEGALQNHVINGRIPKRSLVNYLTDGVPYYS